MALDFCMAFVPFLLILACIAFLQPLLTLFAILTGNKEILNDVGSMCNEEIPHKDAVYSREEMGLPSLPSVKNFRTRQWWQLEDGSWLPLPKEEDDGTPPGTAK